MRDTDATGIVFHPRYLEILTAARESLAKQIGLDQTNILKHYGCVLVAHSIDVKFFQPCYLGEEIIVKKLTWQKIKYLMQISLLYLLIKRPCNLHPFLKSY